MTWVGEAVIAALEARWGRPREVAIAQEIARGSWDLFDRSVAKARRHDVTLFIRDRRGRYAVIRKPGYPPGVFRPASGGIEPGEDFEAGARREAREETGLEVALERYVLRVRALFTHGARREPWTSHVFLARAEGEKIAPLDTKEVAEARWASAEEMRGSLVLALRASGSEWLAYRAALQEEALRELEP